MTKWAALLSDAAEFANIYRDLQSLLWKLYWHHRSAAKGNRVSDRYHGELRREIGNMLNRLGHNVEWEEMWNEPRTPRRKRK